MKYQEFIDHVSNYISAQLCPGQKLTIQPVVKNNGIVYDGLIIIDPILNISPTIYLNPYYHRYLNGVSLEDIYEDILTTYKENLPKEDFDVSIFKEFEKAKKRIVMKLVNMERNQELLQDIPYIPYYDLAIIFVCSVSDFLDEYATILIHNQHLPLWDISLEELFSVAIHNAPVQLPYRIDSMENVLGHLMEQPFPQVSEIDMHILTNQLKIHGATCIVYPNLLKELADKFEDNLIIIPSSIHEVLIIPEKGALAEYSVQDLNEMIQEVNETQLTDDEVLSDHVYLYNRATGILEY